MVFKGQNNRVLWSDECCLLDSLDNILMEEEEEKWEKKMKHDEELHEKQKGKKPQYMQYCSCNTRGQTDHMQ